MPRWVQSLLDGPRQPQTRPRKLGPRSIARPDAVRALLQRMRAHQAIVSIVMESEAGTARGPYPSAIVAIDTAAGTIDFDEVNDPAVSSRVRPGGGISVIGQLAGARIAFTGTVAALVSDGTYTAYRLAIPATIEYQQRREFFRVPVPMAMAIAVDLPEAEDRVKRGEMVDVSLAGIGVRVPVSAEPSPRPGERIAGATLVLDEDERVRVDLEVRQIKTTKATSSVVLGCRFVELARPDRRRLQRFIARVQRASARQRVNG